jgi:lysophospholipase L1-like esterase
VLEAGIDGEQVTRMLMRLPESVDKLIRAGTDVKFVVILGGTNDLNKAKDKTAGTVLKHIIRLHQEVQHDARSRKSTIYTVAVGIPEITGWGTSEEDRVKINAGLREYATQCADSVLYVDWEVAFSRKVEENSALWSSDNVHFSAKGYDKIGDILYDSMKAYVEGKTKEAGGEICKLKGDLWRALWGEKWKN